MLLGTDGLIRLFPAVACPVRLLGVCRRLRGASGTTCLLVAAGSAHRLRRRRRGRLWEWCGWWRRLGGLLWDGVLGLRA